MGRVTESSSPPNLGGPISWMWIWAHCASKRGSKNQPQAPPPGGVWLSPGSSHKWVWSRKAPPIPKKRAWPQPNPSPNCYKPLPRWVSIDPCVIQEARGTSQGPAQIIAPPTGGRGQTALPDPPPDSLPGGGALTDEVGGFGGHEKVGQVEPLDERRVDGQRPAPAPRVVCGEGRGGTE